MAKPEKYFSEIYADGVAHVGNLSGRDAVDALLLSGLLILEEAETIFEDTGAGSDERTVTYGRIVRYVTPWALPDPTPTS